MVALRPSLGCCRAAGAPPRPSFAPCLPILHRSRGSAAALEPPPRPGASTVLLVGSTAPEAWLAGPWAPPRVRASAAVPRWAPPRPSFGRRALVLPPRRWWAPRVRASAAVPWHLHPPRPSFGCRARVASTALLMRATGPSFGLADSRHGAEALAAFRARSAGSRPSQRHAIRA